MSVKKGQKISSQLLEGDSHLSVHSGGEEIFPLSAG